MHKDYYILISDYIKYLEMEKKYSSDTIRAYSIDLNQFFSYFDNYISISKMKIDDIQRFIQYLSYNKLSERTIYRKIASIKSLFEYLSRYEIIKINIAKLIKGPKLPKRLPTYLSIDEVLKLFSYPYGDSFVDLRDSLILELFYATGIRISELVKIKICDVQLEGGKLKVLGKGSRQRMVLFGQSATNILRKYIVKRSAYNRYKQCTYLFPQQRKDRNGMYLSHIHTRTVYNIVKKYISKISADEKLSPHSLRHTFATHLLNNGADLISVKDLLGHKSLSSTQIYTHVQIDKLKDVYNKAHPHAK